MGSYSSLFFPRYNIHCNTPMPPGPRTESSLGWFPTKPALWVPNAVIKVKYTQYFRPRTVLKINISKKSKDGR